MLGINYVPVIEKLLAIPGIMRQLCEIHERNGALRMLAYLQPRVFTGLEHSAELQDLESFNRVARLEVAPCRQKALMRPTENPRGFSERLLQTYSKIMARLNEVSGNELESPITLDDLVSINLLFATANDTPGKGRFGNREVNDLLCFFRYFNSVQNSDESPMGDNMAILQGVVTSFNDAAQDIRIAPLLLIPCLALDYKYYRTQKQGRRQDDCFLLKFLLARTGLVFGKFFSLQTLLEKRAEEEKAAFESSRSGWVSREGEAEYAPYVTFILDMLCHAYRKLETQVMAALDKGTSRTDQILKFIRSNEGGVGKHAIQKALPHLVMKTIERELFQLMQKKQIAKLGVYRDTVYKFIGNDGKPNTPPKLKNDPVPVITVPETPKNNKNKFLFMSEVDPASLTKHEKEKPNQIPSFMKDGDLDPASNIDAEKKTKKRN